VGFGQASAPSPGGSAPRLAGPPAASVQRAGSCLVVERPGAILQLPPGGVSVRASGAPAEVALRRFSDSFSVASAQLGPHGSGVARIPLDQAGVLWELALRSEAPATVCGIGTTGA
jgi:hypothetical protein